MKLTYSDINCFRNGMLDENGNRILVWMALYDQIVEELSDEGKKTLTNYSKYIDNFYVLSINKNNEKKYIHIEKDETVTLTDEPTCYFDSIFFDNKKFSDIEEMITNIYKESDCYKENGMFSKEIINKENRPNIMK